MLPIQNRLRRKRDIENVFAKGRKYHSDLLGIIVFQNENKGDPTRVAFFVGKKVDKRAVGRNRLKRQLREVVRLKMPNISTGYDICVITRKGLETKKYMEIDSILSGLLVKANLISK